MTHYYFDSSALVKRYLTEIGSGWVLATTSPSNGHSIIIAEITRVEIAAALAARHRATAGLTRAERDDAVNLLHNHYRCWIELWLLRRTIGYAAMMLCS